MKFVPMKGCRRSAKEQQYVWALMNAWDTLPQERKMELRGLVDAVALDATEARALWETLRGRPSEAVARRTAVPVKRIYDLRCRYYERVRIL